MHMRMEIYPRTAVERAMKLQEVLLRATAGKIKWWQAAEMIGISERQMRRWKKRYEASGFDGLLDRRRGVPSSRRVPQAQAEQVVSLYREQYFDLNVRHFHEKLVEEHQIGLSYTWVKQALQAASLVKRKSKRGIHRKRRERRPLPGMMLHIDGSDHQWFQDERRHDLIVILDDATTEIYYAQLAEILGLPKLTFQVIRRSIATLSQTKGTMKDTQGMLRHARLPTTGNIYVQVIAEGVKNMVNSIDDELRKPSASKGKQPLAARRGQVGKRVSRHTKRKKN